MSCKSSRPFDRSSRVRISIALVGALMSGLAQAEYCKDAPVDRAAYKVINAGSGTLLNVEGASTASGANVNTLSNSGGNSQRFYLHNQDSSDYWTIEAAHTDMLVDVEDASIYNGANIIQATASSEPSQEWQLKQQTDGSYRVINRNSGHSLTVAGSNDGANVYQNADASASSQRWWLEPVSVPCGADNSITLSGDAGDGKVDLSWTQPPELLNLQVYQDTDSNPSGRVRLAGLTTTATSYTATGLTNDTTYWFWVKYRTVDGVWHDSNAISATPASADINTQASTIATDGDFVFCSAERETCTFPGTRTVRYGADGKYVYQSATESIDCNNDAFDDPIPGVVKSCHYLKEEIAPSPNPAADLVIGFAGIAGPDGLSTTTGGANGDKVVVTSCSDLKNALTSDQALTIQVPDNTTIDCTTPKIAVQACQVACPSYLDGGDYTYRVPVGSQACTDLGSDTDDTVTKYRNSTKIIVTSNKTLEGLGSGSALKGASLVVYEANNVIIKNLSISDVNPDLVEANDGIWIHKASHIVVDHVAFSMISDGQVDITDSKNVTLSNNHFDGYNPYVCGDKHWYTNYVNNAEVTFHHNFWDSSAGRNPKLNGGATRAHLYNNYWQGIYYFSVQVSHGAQALLEANYFDDSAHPHWNPDSGYLDARISTNVYTGQSASGNYAVQDSGDTVLQDVTMYDYTLEDANDMLKLKDTTGPQ